MTSRTNRPARRTALPALLVATALVLSACSSLSPPVTQVEAIAACYSAVIDEESTVEFDRSATRAEQADSGVWTITGTFGSSEFACEVGRLGKVARTEITP